MTLPKDPPIVRPKFLAFFAETVDYCEAPKHWPMRCEGPLEVAHIKTRGMGGGTRKDVADNLARLCQAHHRYFDQVLGQGWAQRQKLRMHIHQTRSERTKAELEAWTTRNS